MFNLVGQDAENQRLHLGHGLGLGRAVGHGSGNGTDLGDPTAVLLLFDFNSHEGKLGGHCRMARRHSARAGGAERGGETAQQRGAAAGGVETTAGGVTEYFKPDSFLLPLGSGTTATRAVKSQDLTSSVGFMRVTWFQAIA